MQEFLTSESALILKGLLARYGVTYKELARRLERLGVSENEAPLRNKINRGTFSFSFFLHCMVALGVEDVRFQLTKDPGAVGAAGDAMPTLE